MHIDGWMDGTILISALQRCECAEIGTDVFNPNLRLLSFDEACPFDIIFFAPILKRDNKTMSGYSSRVDD